MLISSMTLVSKTKWSRLKMIWENKFKFAFWACFGLFNFKGVWGSVYLSAHTVSINVYIAIVFHAVFE